MKRLLALFLVIMLMATILLGCGNTGGSVKTGLAVITSIAKSKDATEGVGLAEMNSTVVAVTVDNNGKIVKCVIDAAQTKVNFSDAGKITTPLDTAYKTKNELGDEYGMRKASGIGKEWNEQAASFAAYVVGKTADEVAGIAIDEETYPTGADLTSSVTIHIGDFITGVQKAVENAKDIGAGKDDKLGLGILTTIAKSTDVGEKAGLAQAYSHYTVTTTDANGVITSCILDAAQANVNFDASGKITSDLKTAFKTKNELGDEYGMKKASGIGKEWYEQSAAFAAYVVGKTATEVEGIAIDEATHPTGADLTSSVTITVGGFQETIKKAAAGAK